MSKFSLKVKRNRPIILLKGQFFVVECAIRKNGTCESKDFLNSLDISNRAKIIKIIKRYADFGIIYNREQFKKIEGSIWEFKEYQTRILMYHCAPGCIALTHGFIKKRGRIQRGEIERAIQIKNEYDLIGKEWKR